MLETVHIYESHSFIPLVAAFRAPLPHHRHHYDLVGGHQKSADNVRIIFRVVERGDVSLPCRMASCEKQPQEHDNFSQNF